MLLKDCHVNTMLSECNPSAQTINAIADLFRISGKSCPKDMVIKWRDSKKRRVCSKISTG